MDAFYGEIRAFPFSYPPVGWAWATGTRIEVNQNPALNAVIGFNFGGDRKTYFLLPDLVSNVILGAGQGPGLSPRSFATPGGVTQAVASTVPQHNHGVLAKISNSTTTPSTGLTGTPSAKTVPGKALVTPVPPGKGVFAYSASAPDVTMNPASISPTGVPALAAHANMQPTLVLPYSICVDGIFPIRP